jgi:hypothetical protein
MNSLRRSIGEADRVLEGLEKEIAGLGGKLRSPERGLTYFYSDRDSRRIFLIWDLKEPDLLTWHELDESFSDRLPVDFAESGGGAPPPPGGRRQEPSTP